jgi:hypothetical protein
MDSTIELLATLLAIERVLVGSNLVTEPRFNQMVNEERERLGRLSERQEAAQRDRRESEREVR